MNSNKILKYIEHILEYNNVHMLTGFKTIEEIQDNLINDSIKAFANIDLNNKKVLDIGTGCGIPGIPLKLNNKSIDLYLLEAKEKRVKFLKQVNEYIDFNIIHDRAEDCWINYKKQFDVVTMRAFAHSAICLEISSQYLKLNGKLILIKGSSIEDELKLAAKAAKILGFKLVGNYKVKGTMIPTNIIVYKKIKETNKKYPRKFKKIKEKILGE